MVDPKTQHRSPLWLWYSKKIAMIYIGIDTGVHTGVAVWDNRQRSLLYLDEIKIHRALELVKQWKDKCKADGAKLVVRVEDARQRKWFGHDEWKTEEERKKKLQGVGSVKRDSAIWDDFLSDLGVEYQMVPPRYNVTKLTQEQFKAITGWKGRTNEHKRDAAMLVYGF